jgi:hypothetical protein
MCEQLFGFAIYVNDANRLVDISFDDPLYFLCSHELLSGHILLRTSSQVPVGSRPFDRPAFATDFIMGGFWVSERADLTPVYELISRRWKVQSLDWRYRFPELHLIEFPSERPNGRRSYELEKMRVDLERAHREAMDDLKLESVPAIVLAYSNIYGIFPRGWPPWEFNERDD